MEAKADQVPQDFLGKGNTVLMQMETDPAEMEKLAKRTRESGGRVILNLAPALPIDRRVLGFVDYFILNEIEICQLAKYWSLESGDDYQQAARIIAKDHDLVCIVTLGSKGAEAYAPEGDVVFAKAHPIKEVVDTTGAGDAFCGSFAAAFDKGLGLADAMNMACVVGSLACLKRGAMPSYPTLAEVEIVLSH